VYRPFKEIFVKAKDLMIPIQDFLGAENTLKEAVNLLKVARRMSKGRASKVYPFWTPIRR